MRAQKMRIQMAQFEWSDGSVWMVWMLVQMKVMMVPIRWLEMRAQMAAQDSLDAGSDESDDGSDQMA